MNPRHFVIKAVLLVVNAATLSLASTSVVMGQSEPAKPADNLTGTSEQNTWVQKFVVEKQTEMVVEALSANITVSTNEALSTETKNGKNAASAVAASKTSASQAKVPNAGSKEEFSIQVTKHDWAEPCQLNFEKSEGRIELKIKKASEESPETCDSDIVIIAPASLALKIHQGAGDLLLSGLSSALELRVGAGDIQVQSLAKSTLTVDLGAGNILFSGAADTIIAKIGNGDLRIDQATIGQLETKIGAGSVFVASSKISKSDVDLGLGDLDMVLTAAPLDGYIRFSAGTGNAVLSLPKNSRVATEASTSIGTVENEFPAPADGGFQIRYKTAVGDLAVKAL